MAGSPLLPVLYPATATAAPHKRHTLGRSVLGSLSTFSMAVSVSKPPTTLRQRGSDVYPGQGALPARPQAQPARGLQGTPCRCHWLRPAWASQQTRWARGLGTAPTGEATPLPAASCYRCSSVPVPPSSCQGQQAVPVKPGTPNSTHTPGTCPCCSPSKDGVLLVQVSTGAEGDEAVGRTRAWGLYTGPASAACSCVCNMGAHVCVRGAGLEGPATPALHGCLGEGCKRKPTTTQGSKTGGRGQRGRAGWCARAGAQEGKPLPSRDTHGLEGRKHTGLWATECLASGAHRPHTALCATWPPLPWAGRGISRCQEPPAPLLCLLNQST